MEKRENMAKGDGKMQRCEKIFPLEKRAILLILFLMALNAFGRFYYMAFFAAALLVIVRYEAIKLPRAMLPALLLSISLCLFSPNASVSLLGLLKQFTYPLCVVIGYNLVDGEKLKKRQSQTTHLTLALALGAYGHYLLNLLLNRGVVAERNMIDFWTRTTLSATGQATMACMIVAVSVAFLFMSNGKTVKVFMVAILVSVLYYNLKLAGRTLLVLMAVALLVAFVMKLAVSESRAARMRLIAGIVAAALIIMIVFLTNAFNLQNVIEESNFYDRFYGKNAMGISEDGRFDKKLQYISVMLDHPFGGGNIRARVGSYAHDIILDTYDEGGLFAMIAILLMLLDMIIKCARIIRGKRITGDCKILTATFLTVIMLEFMVEPILQGMPWLMASYCVLYGTYGGLAEKI